MRSNIKKYDDLAWLTDDSWMPSSVTIYTNKGLTHEAASKGEDFDTERYVSMGYRDGKPKYSKKKGKMPPFSNPFMWEGIS